MKLLVVSLLLGSGCVVGELAPDSGDPSGSEDPSANPVDPGDPGGGGPGTPGIKPVPSNGLVLDVTLARQLPATSLGRRADDGTVTLDDSLGATLAGPAGAALLKYVAICALPEAGALVAGGQRHPGFYGLAPQWAGEQGCDESCQRWVSACLLAHANQAGTPVEISLRGDAPALAADPATRERFAYQEAAFYGNLFRGELYACMGLGSFLMLGSNDGFLEGRVCGLGQCGIVRTGMCMPIAVVDTSACRVQPAPGGGFASCHVGESGESVPRTSATFREVVTVYLKSS